MDHAEGTHHRPLAVFRRQEAGDHSQRLVLRAPVRIDKGAGGCAEAGERARVPYSADYRFFLTP